jgi:hypothetical protein
LRHYSLCKNMNTLEKMKYEIGVPKPLFL